MAKYAFTSAIVQHKCLVTNNSFGDRAQIKEAKQMKGFRLIAGVIMLLLVFACFISVPVFGENPWDADGTNNSGQTHVDTTGSDQSPIQQNQLVHNLGYNPDWFSRMLFQMSYRILTVFVPDSKSTPATVQSKAK
jgi:hypothetical protein